MSEQLTENEWKAIEVEQAGKFAAAAFDIAVRARGEAQTARIAGDALTANALVIFGAVAMNACSRFEATAFWPWLTPATARQGRER